MAILSQLKLNILSGVWKNLTHTNTHAHTQRAIYAQTHTMQTDENVLEDVIHLFTYLFIHVLSI